MKKGAVIQSILTTVFDVFDKLISLLAPYILAIGLVLSIVLVHVSLVRLVSISLHAHTFRDAQPCLKLPLITPHITLCTDSGHARGQSRLHELV